MKRPDARQVIGRNSPPWVDPEFKASYPNVMAFLQDIVYDDQTPRQTGTLLLFVEGGCLKACVNDRDNNRTVFIEEKTWEGIFDALEAGLRDDTLTWRIRGKYNQSGNSPTY